MQNVAWYTNIKISNVYVICAVTLTCILDKIYMNVARYRPTCIIGLHVFSMMIV